MARGADYALCDRHGRSLAVIEAKRCSVGPGDAAAQAKAYAQQIGVPYAFLCNGDEVLFWEWQREAFPRPVKTIFKQDDLERRVATLSVRRDPASVSIDRRIVERDYQIECIDTLCREIGLGRRKREQVGLDEQTQNLAAEAEILLREWKPGATLERRPRIKGQSKREHTFAFLLDGEYIDVIPANHTATGATMRKAGDVKNSPYLAGREIRVVIDDRRDPDRADVERQILGSLVRAMTLTKLQSLAKPGPVQ